MWILTYHLECSFQRGQVTCINSKCRISGPSLLVELSKKTYFSEPEARTMPSKLRILAGSLTGVAAIVRMWLFRARDERTEHSDWGLEV